MGYHVVITGASSDIGVNLIKMMNKDEQYRGSTIFCQYNTNKSVLMCLQNEVSNLNIICTKVNLLEQEDINSWLQEIKSFGPPTHVIHLAAEKFEYMRLKEFNFDKFYKSLEIQLLSIIRISKELIPMMAKEKYGRMVMMLTAYTLGVPPKFMSHYIAVKYAIEGFMKALASEYAGRGISINAVSPNLMETKFLSEVDKRTAEINAKGTAMKRNVNLDETCAAIMFLMSENASYINGTNLNITGGDYM